MANDIKFRVLGDIKDLENSLSKGQKSFNALGKASAIAFAGLNASVLGLTKLADQQRKAIVGVQQAIISTGSAAGRSLEELTEQAKKLQSETLFGDEVILRNATQQLLTFTNIAETQFDRTQKVALDLATVLDTTGDGTSRLKDVSIQLGKALNDPISNLSALSRAGIQFSAEQKATIKTLVETNNLAEAQNVILTELERQYGGQAKAARDADSGIKPLLNSLSDLGEVVGDALLPDVRSLTNSLDELAKSMQNPAIAKIIADVIKLGLVTTGATAAIWGITKAVGAWNVAMVALNGTSSMFVAGGLFTSMGVLAKNVGLIYPATVLAATGFASWNIGRLIGEVTGLDKALQGLFSRMMSGGRLEQMKREEEAMLASYGVTREQIQKDAAMRIEVTKTAADFEISEAKRKEAALKAVEDEINSYKDGFKEISYLRTQQEVDEYIQKIQQKKDADLEFYNIMQQYYDENNALTASKQKEFDDARQKSIDEYLALELVARKEQQNKLSALDQKGAEIAKKVNQDKVASLSSTLQQAAQLNSKFAKAYQAVAIGEAIMSTAAGVARALKDYPFPANIAIGALVAAAGAVQVASIASQSFAVGTPEIPRDMNATVHKGEMIVPATFSDAIRSGELSLSGGGNTTNDNGIVMDFTGATFNGVTEGFVRDIFEKASEAIANRTLIFRSA